MRTANIAKNIKELRVSKGLSQERLAEAAGISLRTVQRIENNETEPRGYSLQQIASALQTTPEQLGVAEEIPETKSTGGQGLVYITIMRLSALSFLFFPLLGIVIPFILWVIKRRQIPGIDTIAKRLLFFQSAFCLLLGLFFATKINHVSLPSIGGVGAPEMVLIFICALYVTNIIYILVSAFRGAGRQAEGFTEVAL